jgi:hypothetical protein
MRPLTLRLAGSGVLATCALLIAREIGSDVAGDDSSPNIRLRSESGSLLSPSLAEAKLAARRPGGDTSADFESSADPNRRLPGGSLHPVASTPLPAVQLSASARLPAVILAQFDSDAGDCQPTTPETTAASDALEASFYLNLAERVAADSQDNIASAGSDAQLLAGEATAVIEPGPVLDAATATANERFRALFGQNAYNRRSIASALEVTSPE